MPEPQPRRRRVTGIRIWRLRIEWLDLWTGKYSLRPLRDSITWEREGMSGFYVQGDPAEREVEGYKVASQPGRSILITHPQHGRLDVMLGCAGLLMDALEWARDVQMQEPDDVA